MSKPGLAAVNHSARQFFLCAVPSLPDRFLKIWYDAEPDPEIAEALIEAMASRANHA